jgi:uncharacterized repeat protein (TIGR03803 family)
VAGSGARLCSITSNKTRPPWAFSSVILERRWVLWHLGVTANRWCNFPTEESERPWKTTTIFRFSFNNGSWPLHGLALDASGNIYGTTEFGGSHDLGVVNELSPTKSGWKQRVLHEFAGQKDGATPWDGVVLSPTGHLFGTTRMGGTKGVGVVFQVTP